MKEKKRRIGQILLENKLISQEVLDKALEYQRKYDVGITQYLIAFGYINEEELAKCITEQFGFPYLPIRAYDIPKEVIDLVPVEVVKRYLLMPIDKWESILTVVMADPLNADAIGDVEGITDCKVQPFVGILADIVKSIENYYHIVIEDRRLRKGKAAPLFIETGTYRGFDRRKSVRLRVKMDIHFPSQELYKKTETKDISLGGFLFESDNPLPASSYVTLEINLPQEFHPFPVAAVVQVVRVVPLINNKFDVGVKLVKIPKEDLKVLMTYARTHKEP